MCKKKWMKIQHQMNVQRKPRCGFLKFNENIKYMPFFCRFQFLIVLVHVCNLKENPELSAFFLATKKRFFDFFNFLLIEP